MANDIRKGNRSSVPSRGGRRSNTPPPPTVRLGLDGNPEPEPISTSRPRGNDLPKLAPLLENLPASVVPPEALVAAPAANEAAISKGKAPEAALPTLAALAGVAALEKGQAPEALAPAKVEAPEPLEAAPVAPKAGEVAVATVAMSHPEPGLLTTLTKGSLLQPALPEMAPSDSDDDGGRPSLAPRRSVPPGNRKRGSNLKGASTGRSLPPPRAEPSAPLASVPPSALATDEVSTAKAPPVVHAEDPPPPSTPLAGPAPDLDEGFFDHGERAAAEAHHDPSDLDAYDEKLALKNTPEARARRAQMSRYILFGCGGLVALMLVALVMSRSGHPEASAPSDAPASVTAAPPVAPANSAAAKAEPSPVAVVVPPSSSADEAVTAPAASGSAQGVASGSPSAAPGAPADSSKAWVATSASAAAGVPGAPAAPVGSSSAVPGAEPTADDKKSAAQEKRACQSFLDQGAFPKAVEAGEHSVALDPADGEAWLLLGAAYQSMGKGAEARRTFTSCVAEAKRGPINDCRAMLR